MGISGNCLYKYDLWRKPLALLMMNENITDHRISNNPTRKQKIPWRKKAIVQNIVNNRIKEVWRNEYFVMKKNEKRMERNMNRASFCAWTEFFRVFDGQIGTRCIEALSLGVSRRGSPHPMSPMEYSTNHLFSRPLPLLPTSYDILITTYWDSFIYQDILSECLQQLVFSLIKLIKAAAKVCGEASIHRANVRVCILSIFLFNATFGRSRGDFLCSTLERV